MQDRGFRRHRQNLDESWFDEDARTGKALENMVQVKMARTRKITWFRHDDRPLRPGDAVIVETERGTTEGTVLSLPVKRWVSPKGLKSVLRLQQAPTGRWQAAKNEEKENQARTSCASLIRLANLEMKLVDVEYVHWENRTVFYFVAEGRVDFRELVKELSRTLRCRIEMRQIGPRDETKMLGGLGRCGREHCCSSHLREFRSVRTKMAKEQGLVVNQEKITGHCRKLLCCLAYEREVYAALRAELPPLGTRVQTPDGIGKVVELLIIKQAVKLRMEEAGAFKEFPVSRMKPKEGAEADPGDAIAFVVEAEEPVPDIGRDPYELPETGDEGRDSGRRGGRKKESSRGRRRRRRPDGQRQEKEKRRSRQEPGQKQRSRQESGKKRAPARGGEGDKPGREGARGGRPGGGEDGKPKREGGRSRRRRRRKPKKGGQESS